LFQPPFTLKAVVKGQVKGMNIHCEKTLTLGNIKWEVMCKVSDEIDIKYRTQSLNNKQTKLEILIDKQNGEKNKILAGQMVLVNKNKPVSVETITEKARIAIFAEPGHE
jgi:hypothetical protein